MISGDSGHEKGRSKSYGFLTHVVLDMLGPMDTANLQANNLEFQGFNSVRFLGSTGGIHRSTGTFPEVLTQRFLVLRTLGMWAGRAWNDEPAPLRCELSKGIVGS